MCHKEYTLKFNPSDITVFDYPYFFESGLVGRENCDFCKVEMTFAISKDGYLKAFDEKWEKVQKDHDEKLDEIMEQISDLEEQLEDNPGDKKLVSKLQQLENKQIKLEESHETKEEKYADRQMRWEDKWAEKLEKM